MNIIKKIAGDLNVVFGSLLFIPAMALSPVFLLLLIVYLSADKGYIGAVGFYGMIGLIVIVIGIFIFLSAPMGILALGVGSEIRKVSRIKPGVAVAVCFNMLLKALFIYIFVWYMITFKVAWLLLFSSIFLGVSILMDGVVLCVRR